MAAKIRTVGMIALGATAVLLIALASTNSTSVDGQRVSVQDRLAAQLSALQDRLAGDEEQNEDRTDELLALLDKFSKSSSSSSDYVSQITDFTLKSPMNIPGEHSEKFENLDRGNYGGKGDAPHLGGFVANDTQGQSPALWTFMVKYLVVKSVVDVGCGRGISTKWFLDHNVDALCVEGSVDALEKTLLPEPKKQMVLHDFYKGPWWPQKTFDAAWSIEFLEHVSRAHMRNYLPIFHRSALIFASYSNWGGHHHVEVHPGSTSPTQTRGGNWWWRGRLEGQGFIYQSYLTSLCHSIARLSMDDGFNAQHLWTSMSVYVNPKVARLPEHDHLFGGPSCYDGNKKILVDCEGDDELPKQYRPVWNEKTKYDEYLMHWTTGDITWEPKTTKEPSSGRRRFLRHIRDAIGSVPVEHRSELRELYVNAVRELKETLK